jgi:hypothetical protein|tara:strand:+ start:572 stop:841 length:270 start_codon:yes stop_codon:yes gene_type:complete
MNLSDGDFEFIFNLYDEATGFISDKDKPEFASKVILQLHDYGFDIKPAVKEISDHCEFLGDAMDTWLEQEEQDEDIFDEYNEDDESEEY